MKTSYIFSKGISPLGLITWVINVIVVCLTAGHISELYLGSPHRPLMEMQSWISLVAIFTIITFIIYFSRPIGASMKQKLDWLMFILGIVFFIGWFSQLMVEIGKTGAP